VPNFDKIWIFLTECRKSSQYQILRKSFQWKLRWYMSTYRRTDMTKIIGGFYDRVKALKMGACWKRR